MADHVLDIGPGLACTAGPSSPRDARRSSQRVPDRRLPLGRKQIAIPAERTRSPASG